MSQGTAFTGGVGAKRKLKLNTELSRSICMLQQNVFAHFLEYDVKMGEGGGGNDLI